MRILYPVVALYISLAPPALALDSKNISETKAIESAAGDASLSTTWDASLTGKIKSVEATSAEPQGFRVRLEGETQMCGEASAPWAFVNKAFDNYEVMVSTLTAAWLTGKSVTLYMTRVAGTSYCKIGFVRAN